MTDEFDPLNFETGLRDKAIGYVSDAFFSPDPKMGANTLVHLKIIPTDGDEFTEMYNCGPDWRSFDQGESVDHPKGEQKTFNLNAQIAKLCASLLQAAGGAEVFKASGRRDPRNKAFYIGVNCEWERMEISKNPNTGEAATRLMPVKFLGFVENPAAPAATPAQTQDQAPAAATPAPTNGSDPFSRLDPVTQMQMRALARQLSHSDWVDRVMDTMPVILEPANNDVLLSMSDEKELYTRLRS